MKLLKKIIHAQKHYILWNLLCIALNTIVLAPSYAVGKPDIWNIDSDFSQLIQSYSEFDNSMLSDSKNAYFTVTENKTSYKSDIEKETTIDIVLSRFIEFHASSPLVKNTAIQQNINLFIKTRLDTFRNEAQMSLEIHRCYFRELLCRENAALRIYNAYITGEAWHSPSNTILNVRFVVSESFGNTFGGENTVLLFNAKNGRVLSYDDIFTNTNAALQVIAKLSIEKFPEKNSIYLDKLHPLEKNYRNIAFDNEGNVLVFFDKYQVAAGSQGIQKITIDLKEIEHLLKTKP